MEKTTGHPDTNYSNFLAMTSLSHRCYDLVMMLLYTIVDFKSSLELVLYV